MRLEERARRRVFSTEDTQHLPTQVEIVVRCGECRGEKKVFPPISDLVNYKNNGDGTFTAPWGKCAECVEWDDMRSRLTRDYFTTICIVLVAVVLIGCIILHP